MIRSMIQRSNIATFQAVQAANAQKRRDLLDDTQMPAAAKRRALLALEAEMHRNFDDAQRVRSEHEAAALREHALAQPTTRLTAAAFANPRSATDYFELASWASPAERIELARLAVAESDLVAAFALRRATSADTAISDADRSSIMVILSEVTAAVARQADAELYAFRVEASKLDALGWDLDIGANSARMLESANTIASLPREDGSTRHVTTREARELLELAGVPAPEPAAVAA